MRQVLYITPYFPPQSQVGALRPLKFVRHLPTLGWQPVVLADLWPGAATNAALLAAVPSETPVIRAYSRRAGRSFAALGRDAPTPRAPRSRRAVADLLPAWINNPELLPLGEHSVHMAHALVAAREVLERYPACEAILVNADPFAACVVGATLKRQTGLPLVLDLRDPWAPCRIRRPRRPPPQRWVEDQLERFAVSAADHVILNTNNTLVDYRAHYGDLEASRFSCIRNHFDADLVSAGQHAGFDRYTLLHLGRFTRFRPADGLIELLAELRRRGVSADDLQLMCTADPGDAAWTLARRLEVADYLQLHPHVAYTEVGAFMAAADMLVMLAEPDAPQRIASKLYDYLGADRPVLCVTDNPEVFEIMADAQAGPAIGYRDVSAMADYVVSEMALGRQRQVRRSWTWTSAAATAALAEILAAVCGPAAPPTGAHD